VRSEWPLVRVPADEAEAAWWGAACTRELGVPTPEVRFYEPGPRRPYGYVDLLQPGVVFIRHGMGLADTRTRIAHEVSHLAGATEREARRHEAARSHGA
jgi:hypothetical protein